MRFSKAVADRFKLKTLPVILLLLFIGLFLGAVLKPYLNLKVVDNKSQKILLICLDGATWDIMKPLLAKGSLPNFSHLIKTGAHGYLLSDPAFSPPSWTSIATGKSSAKHGVNCFMDAKERKARYLWDIIGDFNVKVGVFNWLMSFPEEINGVMYRKTPPTLKARNEYYPASLALEIKNNVSLTELPVYESVEGYRFWDSYDKNSINVITYLLNKYHPPFIALGFTGTNPYQHRYWSAFEPQYFDITPEELREKANLIPDYYEKIDTFLGYFIKGNYTIIFVSDHGFTRNDTRCGPRIIKYYGLNTDMQHINFLINRMLEKIGLLTFIFKPEDGGKIDLSKSLAYFYNDVNSGTYGIKINREAVKENEIPELRKSLRYLLENAHFETKEMVFTDVNENISVIKGKLPDVTFRLNPIFRKENVLFKKNEDFPLSLMFTGLLDNEKRKISKIILGDTEYDLSEFIDYSRDGVHDMEGVIIMAGRNIRKGCVIREAKTFDVTPTILYLLGLPQAKDMDGKVLTEAISIKFLNEHPFKYIDTYENNKRGKPNNGSIDEESKIIKDRLHSLGYVQ